MLGQVCTYFEKNWSRCLFYVCLLYCVVNMDCLLKNQNVICRNHWRLGYQNFPSFIFAVGNIFDCPVTTAFVWILTFLGEDMSVCNKNQQNAHLFFVNDLIQSYCLRHLSNNQVFFIRNICTCIFMVFFHAVWSMSGCIKHILTSTRLLIQMHEKTP